MTHIEQLIQDMCPNGVEWKTLGEVCDLVTKQTGFDYSNTIKPALLTKKSEGAIPYMQTRNFTGRRFDYETEYYVPEHIVNQFPRIVLDKQCLLISIVGSIGNVGLFPGDEKCFLGGAICVLKFKPGINISFVYEFMSSIHGQKLLKSKIKGSGQSTITIEDIRNFSIPFPPQEVQERIVAVLEKYAALAAELQAELQKRRTQYEYYRTRLLTPPHADSTANSTDDCNWVFKPLEEIFELRGGYTPSKNNPKFWEGGTIPWFRMEDIRANGRVLSDSLLHITPEAVKGKGLFEKDSFVLATSATIGEHAMLAVNALTNQRFTNLKIRQQYKEKLDTRFIFHYMFKVDEFCKAHTNISGFESVDMDALRKMPFPLPPLSEQKRIADLLDEFEKLTTSLTEGIPAEQAAQQKRYEYFRDLLLTFDRKAE